MKCWSKQSSNRDHTTTILATATHKNGVEMYSLYVLFENVVKMLPIIWKVERTWKHLATLSNNMIEHKLIISGIFTYSGFSLFLFLFLFSRKKFFFYFYFLFFFIIFIKQLLLSSSISVVVLVLIHVLLIRNLDLVSPISCNIAKYIWHLNRVIYLNSPARLVTFLQSHLCCDLPSEDRYHGNNEFKI